MAITISGENNNDRILASDGVIDQLSGINVVGVLTATSFTGDLTGDVTGNVIGNVTGNLTGNVNSTSNLLLQIGGSEKVRIDSSGNVGVNETNPAAYGAFVAKGTGNIVSLNASSGAASLSFFENGTGRFYIKTLNGSDGLAFVDADNSTERLRIDSNGAVMIRTTTAGAHSSDLTIGGTSGAGRIMIRSANNGGGYINFQDTTGSTVDGSIEYNHILNSFNFYFESQERFRIHTQGMLGLSGANYGTSGQVLTSAGTGSPVSWTTIPAQATIANNADNRIITGGSGVNLNGEANLTFDGSILSATGSATPPSGTGNSYSLNIFRDGGGGYGYFDVVTSGSNHTGVILRAYHNGTYNKVLEHNTSDYTRFYTGGTERLRIKSDGELVINHTQSSTPLNNTFLSIYDANSDSSAIDASGISKNYAMISLHNYGTGNPGDTTGIGFGAGSGFSYTKGSIAFARSGSYGTGDLVFLTNNDQNTTMVNDTDEKLRITRDSQIIFSDCDVSIGRDTALANYADGSTTRTQLAVVKDGGGAGSGYHEVAHFTGGTDTNDTGAIVRITQFNNDRGLYIKAGRGTSDQAKAIFGLRNSAASDNDVMIFEQGGRVTKPNNPGFLAYHYGHDINYGVGSTLPYPFTSFNTGNHYNTSNSTFTAPVAGRYLFSANANGNYTSGASGIPRAYWKINGSNVGNGIHLRGPDATDQGLEQRSQTVIFNLAANDTVKIVVGQNQWDLFGANSFMGYLIG